MNSIAAALSFSWASIGIAVADHLWQSTLFVVLAAVLTLALKKNQARVRYWLWLAASLKFLFPFSVLVLLGSTLHWSEAPANSQADFSLVIEQIGQPFSSSAASYLSPATHSNSYALAARMLPFCLLTLWLAGFVATLLIWYLRWRRTHISIQGAKPAVSGRELHALRELERLAGIAPATDLVVSKAGMEPGIVGIFRPVMFLPTGIPDRLSDSELAAVIAHELCHIVHRDNLTAAIQMLVEAVFWFHPIVFWIGARMIAERERACDEEVLALGSDPQIYAEGILKVCKFYLETPLACVAGVTGSNLKKRIEAIMVHRITRKLEPGKKLLLALVAVAVIAGPVALGILHPATGHAQVQNAPAAAAKIESASIKPGEKGDDQGSDAGARVVSSRMMFRPDHFKADNVTLNELIRAAFGIQNSQIVNAPEWAGKSLYEADIKFTDSGADHVQRVTEQRLALQGLLADRFKLATHRELKQIPVYELAVGSNGSKLAEVHTNGEALKQGLMQQGPGHFVASSAKISTLIAVLEFQLGVPIVDKTSLKGNYDFSLTVDWPETRPLPSDPAPLLRAVSEQLGLELKPASDLVEVLVIDHAEPVSSEQKDLAQNH